MKDVVVQFFTLVILFIALWFGLSKINWLTLLKIEKAKHSTEEKLGELIWDTFKNTSDEIHNRKVQKILDTLVFHLCDNNKIPTEKIKLHIINKDEVNAFALPDRHLIIYSGLVEACESEAELLGVLGHEIAHMEKNHVMKKLIKEIGLSVLISMTTGNAGGEAVSKAAKLLSSSAYDRALEKEADITSADYLLKAEIDPEPFANFLYKLSTEDYPSQVYWVSTHPESKERAEDIIEYIKDKKVEKRTVLTKTTWSKLQEEIKDEIAVQ